MVGATVNGDFIFFFYRFSTNVFAIIRAMNTKAITAVTACAIALVCIASNATHDAAEKLETATRLFNAAERSYSTNDCVNAATAVYNLAVSNYNASVGLMNCRTCGVDRSAIEAMRLECMKAKKGATLAMYRRRTHDTNAVERVTR